MRMVIAWVYLAVSFCYTIKDAGLCDWRPLLLMLGYNDNVYTRNCDDLFREQPFIFGIMSNGMRARKSSGHKRLACAAHYLTNQQFRKA